MILGPPVAALVGIGVTVCWEHRVQIWAQATLAVTAVMTAVTGYAVLHHVPHYQPWLRWVLVGAAVVFLVWLTRVDAPWTRQRGVHLAVWVTLAVLGEARGAADPGRNRVSLRASGAMPAAGRTDAIDVGRRPLRPSAALKRARRRARRRMRVRGRVQSVDGGHAARRRRRPTRGGRRSLHMGRGDGGLDVRCGLPTRRPRSR